MCLNTSQRVNELVMQALDTLEQESQPLSRIIQKCIRIARLRSDYLNLWWLEWEMYNQKDRLSKSSFLVEIKPHFIRDKYENFHKYLLGLWIEERSFVSLDESGSVQNKEMVLPLSVGEIEIELQYLVGVIEGAQVPSGLHPLDLYFANKSRSEVTTFALAQLKKDQAILEKIRQRVHDFLSQSESQLLFGQLHSDIFEQNRRYVDLRLGQLCPEALEQFTIAYQRMEEDTPESRAQGLLSSRRLLKSLADVLYPATDTPVTGKDGLSRNLTEDKYISRLWQFLNDNVNDNASGKLLMVQTDDLGKKIDLLYELTNKGVHAEVSKFEVNQCAIQLYLLVGDLIRIYDDISAINERET